MAICGRMLVVVVVGCGGISWRLGHYTIGLVWITASDVALDHLDLITQVVTLPLWQRGRRSSGAIGL
ncbi:UNVERIFIED_CONTAM: hypothetical protein Sradi_0883700 [Sesamum radiatum]|uniref:Uncharacterized protein n=1 Tax=Sesamum radiatum TaxID=300843 RepID=A0AAW2V1L3_SESRA